MFSCVSQKEKLSYVLWQKFVIVQSKKASNVKVLRKERKEKRKENKKSTKGLKSNVKYSKNFEYKNV